MSRKAEAIGAAVAGMAALHEHTKTLRQERQLAGKPTFGDKIPFGLLMFIFAGLLAYALALIIVALWPWLVTIATLYIAGLIWRHSHKKSSR